MDRSWTKLIKPLAPWGLGVYWTILFTATHVPVPDGPPGSDKVLHFGAYLVLSVLFATTLHTRGAVTRRLVLLTIGVLFSFAIFDELTQMLVNRHCSALDALADWCGVLAGLGTFFFAVRKLIR